MSKRQLVIFTVGPVQSFIASARKTEDFWSGSYILSYLVREAMKELYQADTHCEIVYPLVSKEELENPSSRWLHIASIPNRFTAIVEGEAEKVKEILQETEERVHKVFCDFCFQAIDNVFPFLLDREKEKLKTTTEVQIRSFLEIYWVIEPYDETGPFKQTRERAERRLGALKNEKRYESVPQHGLVCTVCKEREALCLDDIDEFDRYGTMKQKLVRTWERRAGMYKEAETDSEQEQYVGRIKNNEFLCGICLGKRVARDYFAPIFKAAGTKFRTFPSVTEIGSGNYYAILMMDGDNMGKWFSGENKEDYSRISQKLAHFSQEVVPSIVETDYHGRLVYAGGDDVLAFVPVDEALKIAEELRFAFSDEKKGLGKGATASVGLIVAHKKAPLQLVLNEVRRLEKKAKSYYSETTKQQKDALAIAVHTRSGEISETVLPWTVEQGKITDELHQFLSLLKESLSSTFIHHFTQAFYPLLHEEHHLKWENKEMVRVELRRLLKRSMKEGAKIDNLDSHVETLMKLHDIVPSGYDFLYLLKILTFFKRKEGTEK
jgi:CRISPR-associated protein Cmr2